MRPKETLNYEEALRLRKAQFETCYLPLSLIIICMDKDFKLKQFYKFETLINKIKTF